MTDSRSVTLYDIPSRAPRACWSFNPWKIRLVLNFKNLPYNTHWTPYPSIAPTLSALSIPPSGFTPAYTIPAVRLPSGAAIMDSLPIARALEELQPLPSLHLDWPRLDEVRRLLGEIAELTRPDWVAKVPRNVLDAGCSEYFLRTRRERFGMGVDELEERKGGDRVWTDARAAAGKLGGILGDGAGPFFMGEMPSYADFCVVSLLKFYERIGGEEMLRKALALDETFPGLYEACAPWLLRDD